MVQITVDLLRKRSEHNEGMVSTLEEVALHQQSIEKIELLGQVCPHLKILYLQNNLISKLQNLHKLKALQYLNLAVNNITKIQNLQKCESLEKLDLTINFVPKSGLLTVDSLVHNEHLKELYLLGNPCADWHGYRPYVIAKLPQLKKLDGQAIKPSERIAALQEVVQLDEQLRVELRSEGIDPDQAGLVEDDSILDESGEVKETGHLDENGEMRRPWCAATRILEHREQERLNQESEDKKRAAAANKDHGMDVPTKPARRDGFPELQEGERFFQKNEGQWDFTLQEDEAGSSVELSVDVGKFLDTSLIKVDTQPSYIRLLIKGKLLQLLLPCEVRPDTSTAQRSNATGRLVITMPKESPGKELNMAHVRPSKQIATPECAISAMHNYSTVKSSKLGGNDQAARGNKHGSSGGMYLLKEVQKAKVLAAGHDDDDDFIPDL
ncbi:hypothetical protein CEUSTIGMA_g5974.t1 [Chlamydomonas eustigma]|uniref:U2A'/phosphoprotein 32 family A C-terminal domain-containing protein n=1 Tax=Chlamydomonas eustigma TaxID=1157962 RepID=A0A250X625_9CHLO|nr:hypothetical protein CEUSTIGMA_g5974.t1 [Chlamydomonas eustigma]|eukprot:GAX78534.1 hypothetical protein CEUSTIGMA_g5974.t1 [Chlamydomonas eustigma]